MSTPEHSPLPFTVWTPDRVAKLRELFAAGLPVGAIAKQLSTSKASAYVHLLKLGLSTRARRNLRPLDERNRTILAMFEAGYQRKEIAAELGLTTHHIGNLLTTFGLSIRARNKERKTK